MVCLFFVWKKRINYVKKTPPACKTGELEAEISNRISQHLSGENMTGDFKNQIYEVNVLARIRMYIKPYFIKKNMKC